MTGGTRLFTSESVTEGHPDKVADQVSDSVLDEVLSSDPDPAAARVACETFVTTGMVLVGGEITTASTGRDRSSTTSWAAAARCWPR